MALTSFVYLQFPSRALAGGINWATDDIRLMLLTAAYTPDQVWHQWLSSVVANEATGTNWPAGGQALTGKGTGAPDGTLLRQGFMATNLSVPSVTVTWRYGLLYNRTPMPGSAANDLNRPLIGLIDWGSPQTLTGATFSVVWSATGVLTAVVK